MGDNAAVLDGFTQEVHAESPSLTLYLLVRPGTDFSDSFRAWDMDEQEYITVNGWLFTVQVVNPLHPQ